MKQVNAVVTNEIGDAFGELRHSSCQCRALLRIGRQKLTLWPQFIEDLFWSFYLEKPVFRRTEEIRTSSIFNMWLLQSFTDTPEYGFFRPLTVSNIYGSGLATVNVGWFLLDRLDRDILALANKVYRWEDIVQNTRLHVLSWEKIVAVEKALAQKAGRTGNFLYEHNLSRWESKLIESQAKLASYYKALNDCLYKDSPARFDPVRRDDIHKELKETKITEGAWGSNSSSWDRKPLRNRNQLMDRVRRSVKLKRLLERLGRMRQIKGLAHRADGSLVAELWGIEQGNDIERLLPEEALGFLVPRWKKLFYRNFMEQELSLYRYRHAEAKRRGPMIICLDNSGSMQGPKEEVSKILTLSMLEVAARSNRDLIVVMFGGRGDELKVFEAPGGNFGPDKTIEMAEYFLCSSGTDFQRPLEEALIYLRKYHGKGDIVFVSDGICRLEQGFLENFREAKKKLGFKTTCIVIHYGKFTPDGVNEFGDEVLISKDLLGHDVAPSLWSLFN